MVEAPVRAERAPLPLAPQAHVVVLADVAVSEVTLHPHQHFAFILLPHAKIPNRHLVCLPAA